MARYILDVETNNLMSPLLDYTSFPYKLKPEARLWCIVVRDIDSGAVYHSALEECTKQWMQDTLADCTMLITHNGIKFDLPMLKLFGVLDYRIGYMDESSTIFDKEVKMIDTLIWSRLFYADRKGGHGLGAWGERLGEAKGDFTDFSQYSESMSTYCIQDTLVTQKVYEKLLINWNEWDWAKSYAMELKLADLAIKRESFGFAFDKEAAEGYIVDLDGKMDDLRQQINPILPPKRLNQGEMNSFTPPKIQFKKDGSLSAAIQKFAEKIGGSIENNVLTFEGKAFKLPVTECVKDSLPADIGDLDHVKSYLLSLGWSPVEWKERDLTKNAKKQALAPEKRDEAIERYVKSTLTGVYKEERLAELGCTEQNLLRTLKGKIDGQKPIRVPTSPAVRVGVEKELCPNLLRLGEKAAFAKGFTEYLTYKHRRNSIAGGGYDEDGEPITGFLSMLREDGRVSTPSIELGAACLVADTLITTDRGLVPVINLKLGDEVLTHEGRYRKIVDIIDNGVKPVYEVTLDNGMRVICTENHQFHTPNGWVMCKELVNNSPVYTYGGKELWGVHHKFPKYKVSSWGRIVGARGFYIEPIRGNKAGNPAQVDLYYAPYKKYRMGVGKLVAETFLGDCPIGLETRHLDGNPWNNNLENLKFGTSKENSADMRLHGRIPHTGKISDAEVQEILRLCEEDSQKGADKRIASLYSLSREHVRDIRTGKKRTVVSRGVNTYRQIFSTATVVSVVYRGAINTYDATVAEDHSYVANGIVTHNTGRYRHIGICNIARVTSLYGKELRSLFGSGKGYAQLGFDFSSLEARVQGHYVKRYTDGEALAVSLVAEKPYDIHSLNAIALGISRGDAKSFSYAAMYGAQPTKLAKMLGVSLSKARRLFAEYWDAVPALKELKAALEKYWQSTNKSYIIGIDGRKLYARSQHSLINLLFQGSGSALAKWTTVLMMKGYEDMGYCIDPFEAEPDVINMIEMHDEVQVAVKQRLLKYEVFDIEEEANESFTSNGGKHSAICHGKKWYYVKQCAISDVITNAIDEACKRNKFKVELGMEWAVANNWRDTH